MNSKRGILYTTGGIMKVINNMLEQLKGYEVDGLRLINKDTKEVECFSTKEELFITVYGLYLKINFKK